jgi:hypothetical protein
VHKSKGNNTKLPVHSCQFPVVGTFYGTAQGTGELQFAMNSFKGVISIIPPSKDSTKKDQPNAIIDTTAATGETGKFIIDSLVIRRK